MFVKHRFFLDEYTKDLLYDMEPKFGYEGFGEFIFYRTYSRVNKEGKQETWADVVIRVIEGTMSIRKDWYLKNYISWDEKYWQSLAREMSISMFNMEWLPPGRGLWAMGTDFIYDNGAMALYNCGATDILFSHLDDDYAWLMDSLMLGVGVGFGPEREEGYQFKNPKGSFEFEIPDSREGWVEGLKLLFQAYMYGASKPKFIYDIIRPKGLPIKRFGGISSGHEPLKYLYEWVEQAIDKYMSDKYYDSVILKTDIANQVGCMVVSGNVRRSAELAACSINDPVFIHLKDYTKFPEREAYGWMSNNAAILEEDEDFEKIPLLADGNKRRCDIGFLNLRNFPKGRIGKKDKIKKDRARKINPCWHIQFSHFLTKEGIKKLENINIGDYIWSEWGWTKIINKWSTGINKTYRYKTTAGAFYGTVDHQILEDGYKIEVQYASGIDTLKGPKLENVTLCLEDIVDGLVIGDGFEHDGNIILIIGNNDNDYYEAIYDFILDKYSTSDQHKVKSTLTRKELPKLPIRQIPQRFINGSINKKCSFLRGIYSANGSLCGGRVTLKAVSFSIIETVQLMLSSLGIRSYYTTNKEKDVEFSNGIYTCKESYDLNITTDRRDFAKYIGFIQKYKQEKLIELCKIKKPCKEKITYEIVEVEYLGEEETFDITVDNPSHTLWCNGLNVSNCAEILLETAFDINGVDRVREVCNVDDTFPMKCRNIEYWLKACEYATIYASTVSLLPTHQPSTNRVVARNRRIGVGICGITDWLTDIGMSTFIKSLRKGYKTVRRINKKVNAEAGIPESIRVTTVKPNGTTSKLVGATAGAGYPNFHYMIRRVRVARNSPIHEILVRANVPYEPDLVSQNTDVFEFPIITNTNIPQAEDVSIWQQAMNLVILQREWADNSVSNTLNFRPKWTLVKHWEEDIEDQLRNWYDPHQQNQYETNAFIQSIYLCEEYIAGKFKLNIRWNLEQDIIEECKIYEFDPRHEEDAIEAVLASIAPVTKTGSVISHTNHGVYEQMPESGITKEEYEERKSLIKHIDWSKLSGSMGQDEKFCTGESCEILRTF